MNDTPTPFEALTQAVDACGGQSALARICEVTQPSVWKWVQSSKRLPAEHVLRVEAATGVSRHHLRPDIYPVDMPPAPSRWFGGDRRAATRPAAVDRRINGVSLKSAGKSKGISL